MLTEAQCGTALYSRSTDTSFKERHTERSYGICFKWQGEGLNCLNQDSIFPTQFLQLFSSSEDSSLQINLISPHWSEPTLTWCSAWPLICVRRALTDTAGLRVTALTALPAPTRRKTSKMAIPSTAEALIYTLYLNCCLGQLFNWVN